MNSVDREVSMNSVDRGVRMNSVDRGVRMNFVEVEVVDFIEEKQKWGIYLFFEFRNW